jgi:hypothetical protein
VDGERYLLFYELGYLVFWAGVFVGVLHAPTIGLFLLAYPL